MWDVNLGTLKLVFFYEEETICDKKREGKLHKTSPEAPLLPLCFSSSLECLFHLMLVGLCMTE